jgi:pimeloyl-ACP methyl ester carboxylesterase
MSIFLFPVLCLIASAAMLAQETRVRPLPNQNNVWHVYNESETVFVFVHGILSDSRDAWYFAGDSGHAATYWPDLIATQHFDNPSVFLGGFYTEVSSGDYGIPDAAEELYSFLSVSQAPSPTPVLAKKNIIFVAHSLGGIAVRHLLTQRPDVFRDKLVGLALVASPSLGAVDADRLGLLLELAGHKMGQQLKWNDPNLVGLDRTFRNFVDNNRNRQLVGVELIENHFYEQWGWFRREVVVPEESGGRYLGAPKRIGNTDHSSIAKPKGDTDQSHVVLRQFYEQKFLRLLSENNKPDPDVPDLVCRLISIRTLGWRSGHKTRFCIANGYPAGNFNQGSYKNGGICMDGIEPSVCQAHVTGSLPEGVSCSAAGQEVHCFR